MPERGDLVMAKTPDLPAFLAGIPDAGLEPLKANLSQRAKALAVSGDEESRAWSSLYSFLETSIEEARLRRLGLTI